MSAQPLRYEQLAGELAAMIESGVLCRGDRLPSVRQLTRERRLSVSTVLQALHLLEDKEMVEARPQSGYYVRQARASHAEPLLRSPPEAPMQVDISQRLVSVLQAGTRPGVAPLAAALPAPALLPVNALNRVYAGVVRRHPELLS